MKFKNWGKLLLGMFIFGLSIIYGIDFSVRKETEDYIVSMSDAKGLNNVDCLLVLGAGIRDDKPSKMLQERLDTAILLYKMGITDKIIVSGDHATKEHDEVNVMKKYLIENGIPSSVIFMDHAGFSTYDSLKRALTIFDVKNIIVVTQKYHLYRSLYIASNLGINAHGVDATKKTYFGQTKREVREVLARIKDLFKVKMNANSSVLGDKIDLLRDGNDTNDNFVLIKNFNDKKEKYIINSEEIDKIEKIVEESEYASFITYGISDYSLNINGYIYGVEVYDEGIFLKNEHGGKILADEDSRFILSLLN